MLVLTRKKNEGFIIGDDIKITVVDLSKDRVKIGIDAPSDIKIIRAELYDTEKFNMQAALRKHSSNLLEDLATSKKNINSNSNIK